MTLWERLERIIRILVEEMDISEKNVIEKIKRLRTSYEFWRDKYTQTQSIRHYSLFQQDFREYCRLIDRGVVPRKVIEQLNAGPYDVPEQSKKDESVIKAHGSPHRTVVDKSLRQKEILQFLEGQNTFLSLEDIRKRIPVSQQYLRELLATLVEKGLLERRKVKHLYRWRKKPQ